MIDPFQTVKVKRIPPFAKVRPKHNMNVRSELDWKIIKVVGHVAACVVRDFFVRGFPQFQF